MSAILSEPDFSTETVPGLLVSELMPRLTGQDDRTFRLMQRAAEAEERARQAEARARQLADVLHQTQRLASALQAKVTALQAVDARHPLDCYGVARLAKALPDQISLAHVVLAIGSKALDLGNIEARDRCDDAYLALNPNDDTPPASEPVNWNASERDRGQL